MSALRCTPKNAMTFVVHGLAALPSRMASHVLVDECGCWVWTGSLNRDGYGLTSIKDKTTQAHRAAYRALVGEIPDGLVLDHLCRVRRCVNPAHMEPVTNFENLRRGDTPTGMTRCRLGHELSQLRGQRRCLTCLRDYETGRLEKKRITERERRARLRGMNK